MERIGEPGSGIPDHQGALARITGELDLTGLAAVGHRVVHGGTRFSAPTLVDDDVIAAIEALVPLAPLHNPANLAGIAVARRLLPDVPQVAVFDTAFHRTLPPAAATYAIDAAVAAPVRHPPVRLPRHIPRVRLPAHGRAAGPPAGRGQHDHAASGQRGQRVRRRGGRSVATSMGLSPLEGLVMGTRSGDLDPAVVFHLHRVAGMSLDEIDDLLNHRCGLLGLAGVNDMREVQRRRAAGDAAAGLAFDVYCHRIRAYVGAYYALLAGSTRSRSPPGSARTRPRCGRPRWPGWNGWGSRSTGDATPPPRAERLVSPDGAAVAVCVVPTDEELEIAEQALAGGGVLGGRAGRSDGDDDHGDDRDGAEMIDGSRPGPARAAPVGLGAPRRP